MKPIFTTRNFASHSALAAILDRNAVRPERRAFLDLPVAIRSSFTVLFGPPPRFFSSAVRLSAPGGAFSGKTSTPTSRRITFMLPAAVWCTFFPEMPRITLLRRCTISGVATRRKRITMLRWPQRRPPEPSGGRFSPKYRPSPAGNSPSMPPPQPEAIFFVARRQPRLIYL